MLYFLYYPAYPTAYSLTCITLFPQKWIPTVTTQRPAQNRTETGWGVRDRPHSESLWISSLIIRAGKPSDRKPIDPLPFTEFRVAPENDSLKQNKSLTQSSIDNTAKTLFKSTATTASTYTAPIPSRRKALHGLRWYDQQYIRKIHLDLDGEKHPAQFKVLGIPLPEPWTLTVIKTSAGDRACRECTRVQWSVTIREASKKQMPATLLKARFYRMGRVRPPNINKEFKEWDYQVLRSELVMNKIGRQEALTREDIFGSDHSSMEQKLQSVAPLVITGRPSSSDLSAELPTKLQVSSHLISPYLILRTNIPCKTGSRAQHRGNTKL